MRPGGEDKKGEKEYDVWNPRVSGCGGGELKELLAFGE